MQVYHGFCVPRISGGLMFMILQGVCVILADQKNLYRGTGSSLYFQAEYPDGTVLQHAEWKFNGIKFADCNSDHKYFFPLSQFRERLKENHDKVGVTIQNLQHQDSGTFSVVVAYGSSGQIRQAPTQTFNVYIGDPITAVQIEKNQTWRVSTNSCDVDVKCTALGAERVSYLWSGYKTGSGAQLQFSLSPAKGAVTLNCTAANNVSSTSATESLSCRAEQPETESSADPPLKHEWIIAATAGAAVLLIIAVIVAVRCWWKSHKDGSAPEGTIYADVNSGAVTQKDKRSDSTNGMTVYETVDDLRVAPEMTIYAKVTLPQHTKVSTTSSSPYQQVL